MTSGFVVVNTMTTSEATGAKRYYESGGSRGPAGDTYRVSRPRGGVEYQHFLILLRAVCAQP